MAFSHSDARRQDQRRTLGLPLVDHVLPEVVGNFRASREELNREKARLSVFVQPFSNRKFSARLDEDRMSRPFTVEGAVDPHYGRWTQTTA